MGLRARNAEVDLWLFSQGAITPTEADTYAETGWLSLPTKDAGNHFIGYCEAGPAVFN